MAHGRVAGGLPVTEACARRVLSLPIYPELDPQQRAYIATCARAAAHRPGELLLAGVR
jgi:dTDP-4-amino-4,6-dideoxygalactose transaminase